MELSETLLRDSKAQNNLMLNFCSAIFHLGALCNNSKENIDKQIDEIRMQYYNDRVYFEIVTCIFCFFNETAEENELDTEVKQIMSMIVMCFKKVFKSSNFQEVFMSRLALYKLTFKMNSDESIKQYLYDLIKKGKGGGEPELYDGKSQPIVLSENPFNEIFLNNQIDFIFDTLISDIMARIVKDYVQRK